MALTKLTTALNKISSLATTIRGQATTVKAAFDYDVNVVKDFINDTLTEEADALDAENVKLTGDQTLDGIKTFISSPIVPTPTADLHASTKKYVDDNYASKNEITTNRKLSANGDFSGTWNGHEMVETDPGIQTEVNQRLVIGNDYRPSVLVNGSFQVPMPATTGFGLSIWNAWVVYSALATVSVSQLSTGGARISNSTRDRDLTNIHQDITIPTELKGKTITLSVKIKCSVTNQYARIAIVYGDDESHVIGFITPTLNTTDTVYTVTCSIPLDTSSIKVGICLSARFTDVGIHPWGLNGTYFEACDVDISWMKLEVNDHATPFIPKSYKQELVDCLDLGQIDAEIVDINSELAAKLNKTNVANNTVTTAEGFALDARQGKVLQEQINSVTTALGTLKQVAKGIGTAANPYIFTAEHNYIYLVAAASGTYSGSFGLYLFTVDSSKIYAFTTIKAGDADVSVTYSGVTLTIKSNSAAATIFTILNLF